MQNKTRLNPFDVSLSNTPLPNPIKRLLKPLEPLLLKALGFSNFKKEYDRAPDNMDADGFIHQVLSVYNISYNVISAPTASIPKSGPLVVVCNHPFGGIEPVIIAKILRSVRPDIKIMANYALSRITELTDLCIMVDPFQNQSSSAKNFRPLRIAKDWLKQGGVLIVFPAGEVSHLDLDQREVIDSQWNRSVARLIQTSQADVVPFYVHGRNSSLFQLAGLIHPILRTALLGREVINKKGRNLSILHTKTISHQQLKPYKSSKDLTHYLRLRCYIQKNAAPLQSLIHTTPKPNTNQTLVRAQNKDHIKQEIHLLPSSQTLLEKSHFSCFYARAEQIPYTLNEIGRLREETFRKASEGTGLPKDNDSFDTYYEHLFIWDKTKEKLVGAYRIGKTDDIMNQYGIKGLYSATLFKFNPEFTKHFGKALELGRSFICHEYQKTFWPLILLWKGIGRYLGLNPQYTRLFGTVSINNQYSPASQQLIETVLLTDRYRHSLANLVTPKTPSKHKKLLGITHGMLTQQTFDINELSALICDIELSDKKIPVLLQEYLKLGGKLLGFNIDASFNHVLDGLICVDLLSTDKKLLKRYMGTKAYQHYMEHHQLKP